MTRYPTKAGILIVVVMSAGVLPAPPAWATIYQCVDASGANVFSDSAAQLPNCTVLSLGSDSVPSTPSRPAEIFNEPEMGAGPGSLPEATPPQASASAQAIPDFAVGSPPPATELNPAAAPPPSSQPCVSAVNPFNPFAAPPCPSSEGAAPPPGFPAAGALPAPRPE
jgi:hypothetical protein